MEVHNTPIKVYIVAAIAAFVWGLSVVFNKIAVEFISPIEIMAIRTTVAVLIFIILIVTKIIKVNFKGKKVWPIIVISLAHPCIGGLSETTGMIYATATEASIILALAPVLSLVWAKIFFDDKIYKKQVLFILLSFIGVLITTVFTKEFSIGGKLLGYLLVFVSVICGGIYGTLARKYSDMFNPMEVTVAMAFIGFIFFNTLNFTIGNGIETYFAAINNIDVLVATIFLGLFSSIVGFLSYSYTLSKIPIHRAAPMVLSGTTVVGVVVGIIYLNDPLTINVLVGLTLVLVGIVGVNYKINRKEENKIDEFIQH